MPPGSGLDFGIAGIRAAVADVVANRVVEQHRILRHDADRLAQTGLTQLADFRPSNRDAAAVDVVEAIEQAGERRLSGPE